MFVIQTKIEIIKKFKKVLKKLKMKTIQKEQKITINN